MSTDEGGVSGNRGGRGELDDARDERDNSRDEQQDPSLLHRRANDYAPGPASGRASDSSLPESRPSADERDGTRDELAIHYNQLKELDDHLYQYSSVFFTINVGLLAFLAQLLSSGQHGLDPAVYLFICFLGYTSAICIFLIAWKGYLSWEIQSERVRVLESRLGYHISDWPPHSHTYKHSWAARNISIAQVRWVLNLLLAVMWVALIVAFPRLTDVGTSNIYLCFYACLIPGLAAVPMAIMFGPLVLKEFTKGR